MNKRRFVPRLMILEGRLCLSAGDPTDPTEPPDGTGGTDPTDPVEPPGYVAPAPIQPKK